MNMTDAEFEVGMRNVGVDIACGACACQFYTGSNDYAHDKDCTTTAFSTKEVETSSSDTAPIGRTGHIDLETGYLVLDPVKEDDGVELKGMILYADYALVTITYFKLGGKFYMTEREKWFKDPEHYSKWERFDDVPCFKEFIAVCIDTPLGFPHIRQPGVHRG